MTSNPYGNLPEHHFWRRSVSNIEPFMFDPIVHTKFRIEQSDLIATAGSCFAQHISRRLSSSGYKYLVADECNDLTPEDAFRLNYGVFSARYGNIYTVRQLLQLFDEAFDVRPLSNRAWVRSDHRYVDALRPHVEPDAFDSPWAVLENRRDHLGAVRRVFSDCDVFVFTLGLTETWQSTLDGTVVPIAPGVSGDPIDSEQFEFLNLDVHQTISDLDLFLCKLRSNNANVKVILTVSPVPLIATYEKKNVLVATTYSKSVLRVAAEHATTSYDWVEYFPSYEIITGSYACGRYFANDLRGIRDIGVDHVMRCFMTNFVQSASAIEPRQTSSLIVPASIGSIVCDEEALDSNPT